MSDYDEDFIPWSDLLPGAINADGIGEGNVITYRIASLRNREVAEIGAGRKPTGRKIVKPVLGFEEGGFLVVNVVNKGLIADCLGKETPGWKGKRISMTAVRTHYFGGCLALRVCGSPDMAEDIQTEIEIGSKRKGDKPERIKWTLKGSKPTTTTQAPRPLADILAAIPRGEARLTPEALAVAREPFGLHDDTDLSACPEPLVRGYYAAIVAAVKGA